MKDRKFRFKARAALNAVCFCSVAVTVAHAGQTCKDSALNSPCSGTNSPCVCVERADLNDPPPAEGFDFTIDIVTDPSNPVVTFMTGHSTNPWGVWSQTNASDTTPAAIGTIKLDYSGSDDFKVLIQNRDDPVNTHAGASNLATILLTNGPGFTGFTSIEPGSELSGNLTGKVNLQAEGTTGGDLNLIVGGFSAAPITAYSVTLLRTGGFLGASLTVQDEISVLDVGGDLSGTVGSTSQRPSIVDLNVGGTVSGNVWASTLTDADIVANVVGTLDVTTVAAVDIVGSLSGSIVATTLDHLAVGTDQSGSVTVSGTLTNLTIGGSLTGSGSVSATTITDLDVVVDLGGNGVSATDILAADIGGDLTSSLAASGILGSLSIGGSLTGTGSVTATTITDLDVVVDLGGNGVSATTITAADIGGNLTSSLSASSALVDLSVGGHVFGTVDVSSGTLTNLHIVGTFTSSGSISTATLDGTLAIDTHCYGDLTVSDAIEGGSLTVRKAVGHPAYIEIGDMTSAGGTDSSLAFNTTYGDFNGDLVLDNGLPEDQTVMIKGTLTSSGSVDFKNDPIAGIFTLEGGGSGTLLNGGQVTSTGKVWLAQDGKTFSGSATVESVAAGGIVGTKLTATLPYLSGDINVGPGDMAGDIKGGKVQASATISVATMSGQITIADDLAGDITASGAVSGTIQLNMALGSTAQIQIDGLCTGPITIEEETSKYSLIWLRGGLGTNGLITVNDSTKSHNAKGTIHVGPLFFPAEPPFPSVTFDGAIMIKAGSGGGGDLRGEIKVVGCHASDDLLDICICGDGYMSENQVDIDQDGCDEPLVPFPYRECVPGC